jgi:predicted dithiol-disulfide oxidoreductase (DUF899 family)
MPHNPIVSRAEWLDARKALLAREKEQTRLRDAVNAERLALPWVRVQADYRFQTAEGEKTLADLFDGRSQLVVYHFMLQPGWEAGCKGCSFLSDHFDGTLPHLTHHDVTLVAVSRAPLDEIDRYRARMGWHFPWVSSNGSAFNYDFGASFHVEDIVAGTMSYNYAAPHADGEAKEDMDLPGLSAFVQDEDGAVYHTYSTFARGLEEILSTYAILDRAPLGRNEGGAMDWMKRHDEYADAPSAAACCA